MLRIRKAALKPSSQHKRELKLDSMARRSTEAMKNGLVPRIGIQEVEDGISLDPPHVGGALPIAFFEKSKRRILFAELRMIAG